MLRLLRVLMVQHEGVTLLRLIFSLLIEDVSQLFTTMVVSTVSTLTISAALHTSGEALAILLEASTTPAPATSGVT